MAVYCTQAQSEPVSEQAHLVQGQDPGLPATPLVGLYCKRGAISESTERHESNEQARHDGGGEEGVEGVRGEECTKGEDGVSGQGSGERGELVGLKLELAQQIQRLRELCASEAGRGGEREEEEVVRERRLMAEQVSAMARKIYDLQLQVSWSC